MAQTLTNGREIVVYAQTEPVIGDRFTGYRWRETTGGDTDPLYAWEWEWNGTYWLGPEVISPHILSSSTIGGQEGTHAAGTSGRVLVTEYIAFGRLLGAQDASNYWTLDLNKNASNWARTNISTLNTQSSAVGAFYLADTEVNELVEFSTFPAVVDRFTSTGSPGGLSNVTMQVKYRVVRI